MSRFVFLTSLLGALGACGGAGGAARDAGFVDGGRVEMRDDGGSSADGGAADDGGGNPEDDGGLRDDGGACSHDSQCALAHRCYLGACQPHAGGTGAPCPNGDECAVDALCTGSLFASMGPTCIRACSAGACPGDYRCQWWERVRDGGAVTVSVCLPRNAFGLPCRSGGDPVRDCNEPGQYCGGRSHEVGGSRGSGFCIDGAGCDFRAQSGCAANETCHPAGVFGYDNNRATLCEPAAATGRGQGEPCGPCGRGYGCVAISSRHALCMKYCTPNDSEHGCAGVPALSDELLCDVGHHSSSLCPDGGPRDGGAAEARCHDLFAGAPASTSSLPAGVCR